MVSTFTLCKFLVISSLFLTTCLSSLFRPISYYYKLNILPDIYELHGKANSTHSVKRYICRNVPGHGSCLFYALSSCITYERSKQHIDFSKRRMKDMVSNLRKKAVEVLKSKDKELYVENGEKMTSEELLDMVASHFKTTPEKYCESMMDPSTWGSGTEIVALSNYLKRPIHVYELKVHRDGFLWRHKNFKFRLCAAFGSPVFDSNQPPYAILCADGRFPHVSPGAHKKTGDHFLALFPIEEPTFEQLRQDAERSIRKLEVDDSGGNDEFEFVSDGFSSTHRGGAKTKGVSRTRLQQHLRGLIPQSSNRGPRRHAGVTTLAATTVVKRKHKTDANDSASDSGEDADESEDVTINGSRNTDRETVSIYNMLRPFLPFQLPSIERLRQLHGHIIEQYFNSELERKIQSTPSYQRQVRPEDLEADEQEFFDPYLVDRDDNNFAV